MSAADGESGVPLGWATTTLGRVLDIQPGFASGKHTSDGIGLPHLRPMNVSRHGHIDRSDLRSVRPELADRPERRLGRGDVLFNNTNSLELVGKTALFDDDDAPAFSNHMTRLRVRNGVADPAFIAQLLHGRWRLGEFQQLANNHVSQASISQGVLLDLPVTLPPVGEQRRIADRLDEIERGRTSIAAHLQTARTVIERFRSAVLAAACSGGLTRDWREEHQAPRWQTGAACDVCDKVQSGTTPKAWHDGPGGVPFLKVYNIVNQSLDFGYRPQFIAASLHQGVMRRATALPGDVVMNIVGPPLGKVAVITDEYAEWSINQALTLFRPSGLVTTGWLYLFLCSGISVSEVLDRTRGTVGQVNISLTQCREFEIPLPSLDEQREITRRAGGMLAKVERLASQIERIETTLDRVSKASLAKAFRGELVPTEAALAEDEGRGFESADRLLARIAPADAQGETAPP